MTPVFQTARDVGLISCHSCHLLCQSAKQALHMRCPRCGAGMHDRKPLRRVFLPAQLDNGLCLGKVKAAVQKSPLGKLSRLSQTATIGCDKT